ncbi:bifunctional folylpolyglutamate synthase/dihydrofolate synthase [Candidatus Margulisiibacteriota bacterium]
MIQETIVNNDYQTMSLGLERISKLLTYFSNTHKQTKIIHIGGTNGKGTVSRLVHFILTNKGFHTGLFTSPHLLTVRERFQINNTIISDADFNNYQNKVIRAWTEISDGKEELTLFERYTAMAFLYFADRKVEYAVMEVGLGGRLDATNISTPLVSVITSIDYDHQDILGSKLTDIAAEKGGIIKPGVPVVAGWNESSSVRNVIGNIAVMKNSPLTWTPSGNNLNLAIEALNKIGIDVKSREVDLSRFSNPGRLQLINTNPDVLVDGAHNYASACYLNRYLHNKYPGKHIIYIVAILKRKDAKQILDALSASAGQFIFTGVSGQECYSHQELAKMLPDNKNIIWQNTGDIKDALKKAQAISEKYKESLICVTGSLYLIAEYFRSVLKLNKVISYGGVNENE